jgi:hypothetical protein
MARRREVGDEDQVEQAGPSEQGHDPRGEGEAEGVVGGGVVHGADYIANRGRVGVL